MSISLFDLPFLLLATLGGLFLAGLVYFADRRNRINQLFLAFTITMLFYLVFSYLSNHTNDYNLALFWKRLFLTSVSVFVIFTYFFCIHFPKIIKRNKALDISVIFVQILFIFLILFTNFIIRGVEFHDWGTDVLFGNGKNIFFFSLIIFTFIIVSQIFKEYFNLLPKQKLQAQYFLIGTLIFALANIVFNMIFPVWQGTYRYHYFGDYSAAFLMGFTAYAIVTQELFGIRVILTQTLVAIIALLFLIQSIAAKDWFEFFWRFALFVTFSYFGYLLIRSVIQEIKRRAEMQKLYEEVNKLSKSKSEFISIASHQLRTPLTAIKGYISMIIEGTYGQLAERQIKPLQNVYNSNERLIKLVNDLLNLSRLEAGKIILEPKIGSLEEMVVGIVDELRINAENKGLKISVVKPVSALKKISFDSDKLRQVILNIVDNAIKYTKKGSITVEIKDLGHLQQVRVSDTGEGMEKEEAGNLFKMFSRSTAGTQMHTEGAGIGLYVAKQFIEMHKGRIWAESDGKGKGSNFVVELPTR